MREAHLSNRTKIFIGTTVAADTLSEFEADTYVEIKPVYDLGEFGDQYEAIEDKTITYGRLSRYKGTVDGGMIDLIVNRKPNDAGQIKLALAAKDEDFDYNFKIVLPDKVTPTGDGTEFYFRGAVLGGRTSFGEADNVVRTTWQIAINSERLEVEAS